MTTIVRDVTSTIGKIAFLTAIGAGVLVTGQQAANAHHLCQYDVTSKVKPGKTAVFMLSGDDVARMSVKIDRNGRITRHSGPDGTYKGLPYVLVPGKVTQGQVLAAYANDQRCEST